MLNSNGPNSLIGKTMTIGKVTVVIREKIGEGGYAWVYRAVDAQNKEYALKYVNCLTPERYQQFMQEATVLQSIPEHPFIVKLFGVTCDEKRCIIVFLFELCPETAIGILQKRDMTREEILIFFHAICSATNFLHTQEKPILHRDLKPENLLVSEDGTPCLCDFGSATTKIYTLKDRMEIDEASDDIERNTTPSYRAPEMIDLHRRLPIGPPADVWALGCTLYKLVTKKDLYKPEDRLPILQGRLNIPPDMDKDFANLLKMCIQTDPKRRPTAARLTEIALMLRGDHEKIEIPPRKKDPAPQFGGAPSNGPGQGAPRQQQSRQQRMGGQQQEGIGFGWFSSVKDTVRSLVSTGSDQLAIKATFGDSNPPVSKYVRRLVLGSIRHRDVDINHVVDFLLSQRPWQEDARIAAKSLYLILVMAQYQGNLKPLVPVTVKSDQVMAFFSKGVHDETYKGALAIINGVGSLLRSKLMFHGTHPELEGNLASSGDSLSEGIADDSLKYAKTVAETTQKLLTAARQAKDFSALVMCQPAVDEALSAAKLIKKVAPDQCSEILTQIGQIFEITKGLPYLCTAIDYPENIQEPGVPMQRFVASK